MRKPRVKTIDIAWFLFDFELNFELSKARFDVWASYKSIWGAVKAAAGIHQIPEKEFKKERGLLSGQSCSNTKETYTFQA